MADTLFVKVNRFEALLQNNGLFKNKVEFTYIENNSEVRCIIDVRPGAVELLVQLKKSANCMIYSCESDTFTEAALEAIANSEAENNIFDEDLSDSIYSAFSYFNIWSVDQCSYKNGKFLKSLGVLSTFVEYSINDIWIVDDKPELVDFPSHAVSVAPYNGDPEDRELFRVMHQIFIN